MVGDRTGAVHVGPGQTLDLQRPEIDLPFSLHVYPRGHAGLAPSTVLQGVDLFLRGTLGGVANLTLNHGATLRLFPQGRTPLQPAGSYVFQALHVKAGGYLHMPSDPVHQSGISFHTVRFHVDGGGVVRGMHLYIHTTNMTVDASGVVSADGLGFKPTDGPSRQGDSVRRGHNGVINPGQGHSNGRVGSGAGHGGSGGRASEEGVQVGFPYGDLYQPELFGSAGGGEGGGAGGGRLWINVTHKFLLDGAVTASGHDGGTQAGEVGGGGSGGSLWVHTHTLTGYGRLLARGGGAPTEPTP
ncbi:hypothetical protein ACOMHN_056871 [Nucella lapillus]